MSQFIVPYYCKFDIRKQRKDPLLWTQITSSTIQTGRTRWQISQQLVVDKWNKAALKDRKCLVLNVLTQETPCALPLNWSQIITSNHVHLSQRDNVTTIEMIREDGRTPICFVVAPLGGKAAGLRLISSRNTVEEKTCMWLFSSNERSNLLDGFQDMTFTSPSDWE